MEFTVEQLIKAIRQADTLKELKTLVGPSPESNQEASARIEEIDRLWEAYGNNPDRWPLPIKDRHDRLVSIQNQFEAEFC